MAGRQRQMGDSRRTARSSHAARRVVTTRTSPSRGVAADASNAGERPLRKDRELTAKRPSPKLILLAAILLAAVVFAVQLCSSAASINVTVNGSQYALRGDKTLQVAIKESGLPINPGDLISLNGVIISRGEGHPFYATVNGEEVDDVGFHLKDGDVVTLEDGKDAVESYDAVEQPVPYEVDIRGTGPIRTFTPGADGVKEIRTGQLSGEVVEKVTVEPTYLTETCVEPNVGEAKVIALTFDDGPSTEYTADILEILAKNEAKATFFCLGSAVENGGGDLVKRAAEEGHQICTHGYQKTTAAGDINLLVAEEQVSEIDRGIEAVASVLEGYSDRKVRLGNGAMDKSAILAASSHIDAEIGWTVDTGDWVYLSEDEIYDVIMSAESGSIVRMHDGGDHQDVTAAALKRALPKLKKKGFTFVTIDQLMAFTDNTGE